jgi:hypothetical protein
LSFCSTGKSTDKNSVYAHFSPNKKTIQNFFQMAQLLFLLIPVPLASQS